MAEIVLKIPKEFEEDFNADRFRECFMRVLFDCKAWDYAGISGNYEHETLKMLLDAFSEAVVLPKGHGRLIDEGVLKNQFPIWVDNFSSYGVNKTISKTPTIIDADKEKEDESVS